MSKAATKGGGPLGGSSSAPVLSDSPYAQVVPRKLQQSSSKKAWHPPPGAFNHPDLPEFQAPGPGRYTPSVSFVKPRTVGARFGSEDRFKYLGPQQPLEETSAGMKGMYTPQAPASTGPKYLPSYDLVLSKSRISAFSVERRDTGGVAPGAGINPGPGLYTPSDNILSTKRNVTPGGAFLADDRHKYLGQVDPESGMVRVSYSPGPLYKPSDHYATKRAPTVAFGGRGPGTIKKPPSLKSETPGPGTYEHAVTMGDLAKTSTKPRSSRAGFGSTKRSETGPPDSSHCFHGKVPVDMTNSKNTQESPGPMYYPNIDVVKEVARKPIFGTAKRVTRGLGTG